MEFAAQSVVRPVPIKPKEFTVLKLITIAAIAALAVFLAPAPVTASLGAAKGSRLIATMTIKGQGKAKAVYEETSKKSGVVVQEFKVEIEKAKPGSVFEIKAAGKVIGKVKANSLGRGEVHFKSVTDDKGGPTKLPRLKAGDVVTVGPFSGKLVIKN